MKVRKNNLKKPFMEHLQELNNRILVSAAFTVFTALIVYTQYSFFVNLLLDPLINAGYDESNIFAIYEGFQVKLQNTFWISIIITFPLGLLIIGYFIKPALDISTITFLLYFLFFTLLFYLGIGSSLSIAHVGIEFLLSFNENEIILRSQNYFQFITRVSLLFGISFQLPLVILFLLNKGIIKVNSLTKKRPEMFILILIFSAVITPTGDPVSLFIFTFPMYFLIEIMIFIHKKSNRDF